MNPREQYKATLNVFAIKYMVHCRSAFEPGASSLPYYCTPPVCVPAVIGALAVWRQKNSSSDSELKRIGPASFLSFSFIFSFSTPPFCDRLAEPAIHYKSHTTNQLDVSSEQTFSVDTLHGKRLAPCTNPLIQLHPTRIKWFNGVLPEKL